MRFIENILNQMADSIKNSKADITLTGGLFSSKKIAFEGNLPEKQRTSANQIQVTFSKLGLFGQSNYFLTKNTLDFAFSNQRGYTNKNALSDVQPKLKSQGMMKKY